MRSSEKLEQAWNSFVETSNEMDLEELSAVSGGTTIEKEIKKYKLLIAKKHPDEYSYVTKMVNKLKKSYGDWRMPLVFLKTEWAFLENDFTGLEEFLDENL